MNILSSAFELIAGSPEELKDLESKADLMILLRNRIEGCIEGPEQWALDNDVRYDVIDDILKGVMSNLDLRELLTIAERTS